MVDSADHLAGKTGLTVTLTISKAGGAFASSANSPTEISDGWYSVVLTNVDTNTAGDLLFHATGSGADTTDFADQVITQAQLDAQQVGATANYSPTRNAIITQAYRKCKAIGAGEVLNGFQLSEGIEALNLIVREWDADGTHIWALGSAPTSLVMQANIGVYTSAESFPTNVMEITKATIRTGDGQDTPIIVGTHGSYEDITDKFATGTPEFIYLNRNRNPASQSLYVWPLPANVGTQSEVTGTDALNYSCIRTHTADSTNQPITGANWRLFWEQSGSSGSAWATGTAYTAPMLLRFWYKRPLADFSAANDNPDLPPSQSRGLMYELASDLSIDTGKSTEDTQRLDRKASEAKARTFRKSNKEQTTDIHNKATYY